MFYQVTPQETHSAKAPHHIFNINIILTHLFFSMIVLEIGQTVELILIPLISSLVIAFIYFKAQNKAKTASWFVASHWMLAWRRGRILLISYAIALLMVGLYFVFDLVFPGGFSMNNFALEGASKTNLGEIITIRFAAVVIFVAVLLTFMQTGISVYDAGKGIQDTKIEKFLPRDTNANIEMGMTDEEAKIFKDTHPEPTAPEKS